MAKREDPGNASDATEKPTPNRDTADSATAPGRRPATSRQRIFVAAMGLFAEQGYAETSVEDIATAAGISRRTLFRYYPNKAAIPWGEFADQIAVMREHLGGIDDSVPLRKAIGEALVFFNTFPDSESEVHRRRMRLLLTEPELQAHSMLMYSDWRGAIAEFVARRRGEELGDLIPSAVALTAQGIAISAYTAWLDLPPERGVPRELHRYLREAASILA